MSFVSDSFKLILAVGLIMPLIQPLRPEPIGEGSLNQNCICTEEYDPVCTSNGKAYSNPCYLDCDRAKYSSLKGLCYGECPCYKKPYENQRPFDVREELSIQLPAYNSDDNQWSQDFEQEGDAEAGCYCTQQYDPVCGSDGKTYGNACELACAAEKIPCLTEACKGACPCSCVCNA